MLNHVQIVDLRIICNVAISQLESTHEQVSCYPIHTELELTFSVVRTKKPKPPPCKTNKQNPTKLANTP